MKTQINILALTIAVVLGTTSCKKDADNPTPSPSTPTKTELLANAKGWKMVSILMNGVNLPIENCEKDDAMFFKADKTYLLDQGATKCDPNDPQTENGTWKFINNDTQLVLDASDTMKVVTLSADTLRVEAIFEEDGMTFKQSATFVGSK